MNGWDEIDLHVGLSSIELPAASFDFGSNIVLRKTFARFDEPFILVNTTPELTPPTPAPEPTTDWEREFPLPPLPPPSFWHLQKSEVDVVAELIVPRTMPISSEARYKVARMIVAFLRLLVAPNLSFAALSTQPYGNLIPSGLIKCAVFRRATNAPNFTFATPTGFDAKQGLEWIAKNWSNVDQLFSGSAEFRLAVNALSSAPFIDDADLALVSLWVAIESIFSPSTAELKFRTSSLVAAYLAPPGRERYDLQRATARLYDKRSSAVHGRPNEAEGALTATFDLLRRVVLKAAGDSGLPTKEALEARLFGVDALDS